jgi:hypothetical protein
MAGGYNKFGPNDIFYNRVKTHPENRFFINGSQIYYMYQHVRPGEFTGEGSMVSSGHISLYEMNVDRSEAGTGLIKPYVYKDSSYSSFSAVTVDKYFSQYAYGDKIYGVYPMSSSIVRQKFPNGLGATGSALQNTFNFYRPLSPHYEYSSSIFGGNKGDQPSNLIKVPSIFYGSSIKKGSVSLKYYMTGALIAELNDIHKNGELVQIGPTGSNGSGSVAGVVLYNEGFFHLTGAWQLYDAAGGEVVSLDYNNDNTPVATTWQHFCNGCNDGVPHDDPPTVSSNNRGSASFAVDFDGVSYVPTVTMMAHAPIAEFNHSNNLTYLKYNQTAAMTPETGTYQYIENDLIIKNVVSSSYADPTGSFEKTTYISKVGIYDENKNLIGMASLATPVKKTQDREYTFKLKLDI